MLEILFLLEIIQIFLTSFKDTETFDPVYSLKRIAINYILHGSFIMHFLAVFPYFILTRNDTDHEENALRNLLMFKMLRLFSLSTDFIPDEVLLILMETFYKPESRDDKIANDRFIINVIKIIKQIMTTLVTTYFIGLLWYRFSDNWQKYLSYDEGDDEKYFVVFFGLRPPSFKIDADSEWALTHNKTMAADLDRRLFEGKDWDLPYTKDK